MVKTSMGQYYYQSWHRDELEYGTRNEALIELYIQLHTRGIDINSQKTRPTNTTLKIICGTTVSAIYSRD